MLDDRDDLWQVLVVLTERKAVDQLRREQAAKRGGGCVRGESALNVAPPGHSTEDGLDQLVDYRPTPEFAAQIAERLEHLLDVLNDDTLRRIACDKLVTSWKASPTRKSRNGSGQACVPWNVNLP